MADESPRYLLGRRRINETYDMGVADANYAEQLAKDANRRRSDALNYDQGRDKTQTYWTNSTRGFGKGGGTNEYRWGQWDEGWKRRFTEQAASHAQRMQALELQRQNLLRARDYGLQDLELSETERRMQPAVGMGTSPGVEVTPFPANPDGSTEEPVNPFHPYKDYYEWARAHGIINW